MNILAINFNHDGAAAVVRDGQLAGYVNTERFSRRKKHPGVRESDLREVLDQAGIGISEIDLTVLLNLNLIDSPDVPALHGSDLKETWPEFWISNDFKRVRLMEHIVPCEVARAHHCYHAALAQLYSPFSSGVSFACDPSGAQAFFFSDGKFQSASWHPMVSPSVYDRAAAEIFGTGLLGAGKLMGLAPFGAAAPPLELSSLVQLTPSDAFRMIRNAAAQNPIVVDGGDKHYNATLAYYAQSLLEYELDRVFQRLFEECQRLNYDPMLCYSGGVALNVAANHYCFQRWRFEAAFLHPACGDDGTAIGAALLHWHDCSGEPPHKRRRTEAMYGVRTYSDRIERVLIGDCRFSVQRRGDYIRETARRIAAGQVVGWFQGSSEIGPRALGNRSMLADPRSPSMRDYLNRKIKRRESFRPFAPAVLVEKAQRCFGIADSPFMLRVAAVQNHGVPAVTHVDGTSRIQTVAQADNPLFHALIEEFEAITGVPMLLNTSLNGRGEPMVETPEDAVACLVGSNLDALVFPGYVITPTLQPPRERESSTCGAT